MILLDLGRMPYRDAWAAQERVHAKVLGGAEEVLILVEHPPVITFGRRAETQGQQNLIASKEYLDQLGVEVVQSDRGGDVTFHGPGQVVAYPIVRLNDHGLSVGGYVRKLMDVAIAALGEFGVEAKRDEAGIGVWVGGPSAELEKICAIGVRIRRGVSMHGMALNVETDLKYFDLIVPCGLAGKRATSLRKVLGDGCPSLEVVKHALARQITSAITPSPSGRGRG